MKILLIVIGSLAGLYAAVALVQMGYVLVTSDSGSAYGVANIAASVVPAAIGLLVCVVCFQKVMAKTSDGKWAGVKRDVRMTRRIHG